MRRKTDGLVRELHRLAEATGDARAELLAEAGLGTIDRRLLDALAGGSGRVATRVLAVAMLCPESTIEASLSRLRDRRWVDTPATGNGLPATHGLTSAGRRGLRDLQRGERAVDGLFEDDFEIEELRRATRLLRAARRKLAGRQARRLRPFVAAGASLAGAGAGRGKLETCSSEAFSATASAA